MSMQMNDPILRPVKPLYRQPSTLAGIAVILGLFGINVDAGTLSTVANGVSGLLAAVAAITSD